ncbi:MAG TPA: FCD domain-containing protein [Rubrivivax sp.]|nr:FCD domain-containing protein [Rubrivivax sp.]
MPTPMNKRPSDASQAIEVLRGNSLATLALQELERRIVSGEIAAGTKLNEVDVASHLGVSRGPVREAFSALSQAGLVRVEKNRGVFVREVSLEEANEFYEVRAALEGLIGRLAARRIAIDEIEQLRAVVRRMHQVQKETLGRARAAGAAVAARTPSGGGSGGAAESRRADEYFSLNVEFHDLLARAARNNALLAHYRGVVNQLDLYRRATISRGLENIPLSTQEHEAIVDAVAARDEQRAEALLTEHVLISRSRLHAALGTPAPKA